MRFTGTVFRAHHPRWAVLPTSGEGAARHGGRFNPRGVPALYTSRRLGTAWAEAQQGFPFKAQPMTICAYEVDCDPVIDLTDDAERERLGITAAMLACPWEDMASRGEEPPTWSLARRLIAEGIAGILVPSFAPGVAEGAENLVFWRWTDTAPFQVRGIDDTERLPRDGRSWDRD